MALSLALLNLFTAISVLAAPSPAPKLAADTRGWCGTLSKKLRSVDLPRCLNHQWKVEAVSAAEHVIPSLAWGKSDEGRRVLILGAIHGDEISSVSMVFRWIDFLDRTKPDSFLRQNRYLFMPLVNPDGFFSHPRRRTNGAGVDINRNFSTKEWNEKALLYWKKTASSDPRRNPGKAPASELETQVVEKAIKEFKPDLIISVHAPYSLVDHDGPIAFPDMKSPLPVRTLGAFPGSLGTYAGVELNIPVVTPELPNAKQLPDVKSIEQLFLFIMKAKY